MLRYWEDRSERQTARLLGISTGTVKATAWRGLRRLRDDAGLQDAVAAVPGAPQPVRRLVSAGPR